MLFTIAIPVYNGEKTIKNAVLSALNQNYDSEFEVLIMDNASTDLTKSIVKDIKDSRIKLIVKKNFVNMYANHNRCLKEAKGDYIVFCHADDQLLPNALFDIERKIEERNFREKYVLWGHSFLNDYKIKLIETGWEINELIVGEKAYTPFVYGGLTPSGTCYSRKSLLDSGGFVELDHYLAPSDYFTMIKLSVQGFSFEMNDNIFFTRRYNSTLKKGTSRKEILESWKEGAKWLVNYLADDQIIKIINDPLLKRPPLVFLYGLSYYIKYKKAIRKRCLEYSIKKPLYLKNRTFLKVFFNSITHSSNFGEKNE